MHGVDAVALLVVEHLEEHLMQVGVEDDGLGQLIGADGREDKQQA